jgi:hypothetical protein
MAQDDLHFQVPNDQPMLCASISPISGYYDEGFAFVLPRAMAKSYGSSRQESLHVYAAISSVAHAALGGVGNCTPLD